MPTMKDIAKRAGVSYGTVSNVLNKKGIVSLEKIKLVEKAATELGYYMNQKASTLRSGEHQDVALIIPTLDDFNLRKIYTLLSKKTTSFSLHMNLYITDFNPVLEETYFKASLATNKFIIINTCMDDYIRFYSKINHQKSTLIFINTESIFERANTYSLSFDFNQLSLDLTNHVKDHNFNRILFFTERDSIYKKINYMDKVDTISCTHPFNLSESIDILSQNDYDLIMTTSLEKYESIISARKILQKSNDVEIILISGLDMSFDHPAVLYRQDMNLFVEKLFILIEFGSEDKHLNLPYSGFKKTYVKQTPNESINLLLIESPSANALVKIKPHIETLVGFKINVDIIQYDQYEVLLNNNITAKYDLIRIDMANLPEIANQAFKPLNDEFNHLTNYFIDGLKEYTHHKGVMYSLPFDIGCQILMYRDDILNNQLIKRTYYEQTKTSSMIPTTYDAYNLLEDFFSTNYKGIFNPSTVCIGSKITCGNEFLIRLPNEGVLMKDHQLNIADQFVEKALKSYLKSVSYSKRVNYFWDDVLKEYSEGNTVLSIVYSNYIHLLKEYNKDILYKTNFTNTPANKSLIGGGVIGLSKDTTKDVLCYKFLEVLYSDQIGKLITHLGGTMPIRSIYNDISIINMYPWLKLIPDVLKNNSRKHYSNTGQLYKTLEFEKEIGSEVKRIISENPIKS